MLALKCPSRTLLEIIAFDAKSLCRKQECRPVGSQATVTAGVQKIEMLGPLQREQAGRIAVRTNEIVVSDSRAIAALVLVGVTLLTDKHHPPKTLVDIDEYQVA